MKNAKAVKRGVAIGVTIVLLAAIIAVVVLDPTQNTLVPCWYYTHFHVKCLTCGATRAVYYFFTFNFKKAFYYHAYFTVLSPVFAYVYLGIVLNAVFDKRIIPLPRFSYWYVIVFAVTFVAFGVARNFISAIY